MMETWNTYKKNNGLYWGVFCLVWLVLFLFQIEHTTTEAHYLLNGYHAPWLDTFFKYYTYIGGGFPVYLGIVVLFFHVKSGLFLLLGQGVTAIFTQIIKYSACHPRPLTLFQSLNLPLPPTVEGVHLWDAYNSFPSGHTSAIFALFTCLAALTPYKYRYLQVLWLILAFLGAYSRIYLSQHFLDDILAGSLVGALSVVLVFLLLYKKEWGNWGCIQGIRLLIDKKKNSKHDAA